MFASIKPVTVPWPFFYLLFFISSICNNMSQIYEYIISTFTSIFTTDLGVKAIPAVPSDAKMDKIASLSNSNKKTIIMYATLGAVAFFTHLSFVTIPRIKLETFDILQSENWQLVALNLVPLVVYFASIGAMTEINKPISEGTKLTAKNSGLDLNNNDFVHSLKIIIVLMVLCQLSSFFSYELLWSVIMIVSIDFLQYKTCNILNL